MNEPPVTLERVDIPIVLGRDVAWSDTSAADYPIVIGTDLARRVWGQENPVGKRIRTGGFDVTPDTPWMTVIGVAIGSRVGSRHVVRSRATSSQERDARVWTESS